MALNTTTAAMCPNCCVFGVHHPVAAVFPYERVAAIVTEVDAHGARCLPRRHRARGVLTGPAGQVGNRLGVAALGVVKRADGIGVIHAGRGDVVDGYVLTRYAGQRRIGGADGHQASIGNLAEQKLGVGVASLTRVVIYNLLRSPGAVFNPPVAVPAVGEALSSDSLAAGVLFLHLVLSLLPERPDVGTPNVV